MFLRLSPAEQKNGKTALQALLDLAVIILVVTLLLTVNPRGFGTAAAEELFLTILHTNDEHGAVIPYSPTVDFHPAKENSTHGGYALELKIKQLLGYNYITFN